MAGSGTEPAAGDHVLTFTTTVNGANVEARVPAHRTLLDFLRRDLSLTGTKLSCDVEVCGACTVLLDGAPVSSCTTLAWEARGKRVETIEGLAEGDRLHPLQQAFIDHGAFQCGFCTPGMIMGAKAMLAEFPDPTREQIQWYLKGNLCRCTGYKKIVEAIQAAAAEMRRAGSP
jgi:carbon-monoxide dehydrogenase small subunit